MRADRTASSTALHGNLVTLSGLRSDHATRRDILSHGAFRDAGPPRVEYSIVYNDTLQLLATWT